MMIRLGSRRVQHDGEQNAESTADPEDRLDEPGVKSRPVDGSPDRFEPFSLAVGRWIWNLPALLMILAVRIYQLTLSPWLGRNCRFHPSCSRYFIQAVQKYGAVRGGWRGAKRICRCHPWHPGGYDPP